LRVPSQLMLTLPLAMLLGAMWAFHDLVRQQELVAMRTAGVSFRNLVAYLLPVPFVVALVYTGLSQVVVPETEATLHAWWTDTAPRDDTPDPVWVRAGIGPVSFLRASADGERLTGVRIYQLGPDALLDRRISARSARWENGVWHLDGVEELRVPGRSDPVREPPLQIWETNLRPADVVRADIVRPKLSSIMLAGLVGGEHATSQPLAYYQTALYRSVTAPLAPFVMLLLALPAARGLPRHTDGAAALMLALVLGLAFLLCDGFMAALGTGGKIAPALAAVGAPLLFTLVGLLQLYRSEGQ